MRFFLFLGALVLAVSLLGLFGSLLRVQAAGLLLFGGLGFLGLARTRRPRTLNDRARPRR